MRTVRTILSLALVFCLLTGCSSDPGVLAPIVPDDPGSDEGAVTPVRRKLVGDPEAMILHRDRCPVLEAADVPDPVMFDAPWKALDDGYEPCEACQPLVGWR